MIRPRPARLVRLIGAPNSGSFIYLQCPFMMSPMMAKWFRDYRPNVTAYSTDHCIFRQPLFTACSTDHCIFRQPLFTACSTDHCIFRQPLFDMFGCCLVESDRAADIGGLSPGLKRCQQTLDRRSKTQSRNSRRRDVATSLRAVWNIRRFTKHQR